MKKMGMHGIFGWVYALALEVLFEELI